MALFNKGDRVIRISSKDKGIITAIGPCGRGGRQLYKVDFKGVETDELEGNLMPYCDIQDPFELCKNNIYGSYTEFSKINTTFKIHNSSISTISSLKASKTIFKAYQFKPLLKFLNSDNKRILVADEVGLGKTIEAGHIMLELKARNEFRNALVICPISLQLKWKTELKDKFGLTFTIVESVKELIQLLTDNDGTTRAIINYDKIRSNIDNSNGEERNPLIKYLTENSKTFSLILCDEAHKLRNENTQTYKGAEKILEKANSVVFLTATPIMISERNLYNLLHLLDNQRYSNYPMFEQGLRENVPFIQALGELSTKISLPEIAKNLSQNKIILRHEINERVYTEISTVQEHFKEYPLYKRIIDRMTNEEDTLMLRSQLQSDIMSMSQMNQVFSRTRKREVTTDWSQAERHPYPCIVKLYNEEQKEFDKVIENYIDDNSYTNMWGEQHLFLGGALGLVQKKRQIASSVYAYLNDEEQLLSGIDKYADMPDAKFDKLLRIIEEVFRNSTHKIIIFALFRKTLYYLSIRLKIAGYHSLIIHGGVKNREEILNQFQNDANTEILLSSEVGSEGLDMQFCNSMVNYDLPWNPMVVEQRIGRIDRFGQESPIVHIYNMVVKNSVQEDIYVRLLNRIGIFRESIGEMEAILDAEVEKNGTKDIISLQQLYSGMEKDLFCKHLSVEERQKKIDEIAQAFINEKENLKKLEEGLTNSLTNDSYFRNEIKRILNDNAYVTESELKNYVEMLIHECLTTCQLENVDDNMYVIVLPKSNPKVLSNFLSTYQPQGEDNYTLFKQFRNSIKDEQKIQITFNQDYAYKHKDVIFVNLYNPIIQAASLYFSQQESKQQKTFRFDLNLDKTDLSIRKGGYFLAIYQIEISKVVFGSNTISNILHPILFDIKNRCIIDDNDLATSFFGKAQILGEYQRQDGLENFDDELIVDMQLDMAEAIDLYRSSFANELQLKSDNAILSMKKQTESHYKYRINSMAAYIKETENRLTLASQINNEKEIRNAENTLRLQRYNLKTLEGEMEDEICRVSQSQNIEVRTTLLSINLINVK